MNFLSFAFFVFFFLTVTIYYLLPGRFQWYVLLAASIVFYLSAGPKAGVFLAVSILSTFFAAKGIGRQTQKRPKKAILAGTVLLNIGLLLFLKYYNLGAAVFNAGFTAFHLPVFGLLLPMGISFYTLQVVAYCADVYRGAIQPETHLGKYALFVSFFPQIVQGPIADFKQLLPQFLRAHSFDYDRVVLSLQLILWGMFKKMIIADRAGIMVDTVYNQIGSYQGFHLYITAIFYSVQIYADFSGFVDIARGVAGVFGIDMRQNFDHPYFAGSVRDFWRKWHISLSAWLRDYIYIPLGGNRRGKGRKYLHVMLTFLVSGIWHGFGLNFLLWGGLHGAFQVLGSLKDSLKERLRFPMLPAWMQRIGNALVCFHLVTLAWIFFRAPSAKSACFFIGQMTADFNPQVFTDGSFFAMGLSQKSFTLLVVSIVFLFIVELLQTKYCLRDKIARWPLFCQWPVWLLGIAAIALFGIYGPGYQATSFIYGAF